MDKIYEAYMGDLGEAFAEKSRKRIHWICSKVQGEQVLDAGCSQGIGPILLARQGKYVTGLDINADCIAFAQERLAEEPEEVQQRVDFRVEDFGGFQTEKSFDTIVMGEVLEHLLHPEIFIEKANELLKEGGTLVVTVPFGILDDPDHKQTFYYWAIRHILESYFTVTETVYFRKWIGFTLTKGVSNASYDAASYMECLRLEQAFYTIERDAINRWKEAKAQHSQDNEKNRAALQRLKEENQALEKKYLQASEEKANLTGSISKLKSQLDEAEVLKKKYLQTSTEKAALAGSISKLKIQLNEIEVLKAEITKYKAVERKLAEAECKASRAMQEKNALEKKYKVLASSKLGRFTLWFWRFKGKFKHRAKNQVQPAKVVETLPASGNSTAAKIEPLKSKQVTLPTITVAIPTYKRNNTLEGAVRSVLEQDYPADKLEIILSVNGAAEEYAAWLTKYYESEKRIRVVYTPVAGASAGRNYAKRFVHTEFVTYLDDDDYFTKGYLREMAKDITMNTSVVCGRLIDLLPDGTLDQDTYMVKALKSAGAGVHATPWKLHSMFSGPCAKLYNVSQLLNVWGDFDESLKHTEDVVFWVENIYKPMGDVVACNGDSKEAYVRRKLDNSLSRPTGENAFAFYISDRIKLLERYAEGLLTEGRSLDYKHFVLGKIDACTNIMLRYFEGCSAEEKAKARKLIEESDCPFLNKSLFAERRAIAFCHNFSPAVDASAFVASKRLKQLNLYFGETMAWTVVCANMAQNRAQDAEWERFYAKYQYAEKRVVPGKVYFNEAAQISWAEQAFEMVKDEEVPYIYSRSMWAGSHVAALKYKEAHPATVWIAEFSDPLYMGTDDCVRKASKEYTGDQAYLNTFWKDLELAVFQKADQIIFTNENQRAYMLKHNPTDPSVDVIAKSLVWQHPRLPAYYADIIPTGYTLNEANINIGYFGSFYKNRSTDAILTFLENPMVHLHIFTTVTPEMKKEMQAISNRIHLNPLVSHLEVLSISKEMDYLFLNDIQFPDDLTPYLPSKLADYLSVGTPVLALTYPNTPMSQMKNQMLIKFDSLDASFVKDLRKSKRKA